MLVVLCLATGLAGALRGLAVDFWSLLLFSFLFGVVQPILPMNFIQAESGMVFFAAIGFGGRCYVRGVRHWRDAGFALERDDAVTASSAVGGRCWYSWACARSCWRCIWAVAHPPVDVQRGTRVSLNMRQVLLQLARYVTRFRELWVIALAVFGVVGLMNSLVGYVPTYLREIGWRGRRC